MTGLVDSHQHVWDLAAHDQPWLRQPGNEPLLRNFTEAQLRPLAAAAGVTATVVVQTVADRTETPELLALAARSDLIAGVVGWVDLQAQDVADALAALAGRADGGCLRGIRHPVLIEPDPDWLRRPAVHRGLAAVGAAGLCYDIVVPSPVLPAAADAIAACPDVTFVVDHLGNPEIGERPDQRWVSAIRRVGAFPNTFCKLSGILGEPPPCWPGGATARNPPPGSDDLAGQDHPAVGHLRPYYDTVLEAFGPDRLMFGSDWPPCTLSASYGTVVAAARALIADLSPSEQAAILAGTARRAYRLDTPGGVTSSS
jgi:L-fuconolactonase